VGMTRAREELYLFYATSRLLYGGQQHNPPSRFLSEIDAEFQPTETDFGANASASEAWSSSPWGTPAASMNEHSEGIWGDEAPTPHIEDDGPRYVPDLAEGDTVKHPVFGTGSIVELEGDNATIYFKGKGVKKLNIAFAPLKKL